MSFQILVDTVQQRLYQDGVSTLVGAEDWDTALSSNVFTDGVSGTVFLQPYLFLPSWLTSNSGGNAKFAQTDFTLTPAASDPNWTFPTLNADSAPFYKYLNNTGGAGGILTSNLPPNQAMVVEMSRNATSANSDVLGDFGWGEPFFLGSPTGVALRFYADGSCDVAKNGTVLAHYSLSGQTQQYGQSDGQVPAAPANPYIAFLLIPCRERELLVICSEGGGFSHTFADIPEGSSSANITDAVPFWFYAPPGVDQTFRVAPCQYASSGNAIGKLSYFRYDPTATPTGGFQSYLDQNVPSGCTTALQVSDGANPAVPYISNVAAHGVRLNVAMTGGSNSLSGLSIATVTTSPFLYGARGYTLPQVKETVGGPLDVTSYALDLTYDSADSVSGVRCGLALKDPKAIIAAGVALDPVNQPGALIASINERPWQIIDDDGTQILEGLNGVPKKIEGVRYQTQSESNPGQPTYGDQSRTNPVERVEFELFDAWRIAENFIFKEVIPGDGLSVGAFYTLLTDEMGITDSAHGRSPALSANLYTTYMPQAGNPTDKFNTQVEPGDKGSDWLDRLHKTQAGNYFHAMVPMGGWSQPQMLALADMPSVPVLDLYDSTDTAKAWGATPVDYRRLFRRLDVQMLMAEANDVYIQGFDYRTGRPILVHKQDSASMDPTTPPGARLPPWRGQRISYTWIDPTLSTIDACTYAMGLIFPRITIARSLVEIEMDFWPNLRRGQLVTLHFRPGGGLTSPVDGSLLNPVTVRIKAVSGARFEYTANDRVGAKWRPVRYICQVGTDVSNLHTYGTRLEGIRAEWNLRMYSKTVQWGDALDKAVWTRPLILQSEAA